MPLVALGGAGEALVPLVAERLKRPLIRPAHPEVLSSIGAAISLVRAEVTRNGTSNGAAVELALEAERACVASGAAPATVTVETAFDAREGVLRAVATGAVALEAGAADREPAGDEARLQAAATRTRARARGVAARGGDRLLPRLLREWLGTRRGDRRPGCRCARRGRAPHHGRDRRRARREAPARSARRPRATSASPPSSPGSRSSAAPRSSISPTRGDPRTSRSRPRARSKATPAPPSQSSLARRCRCTGKRGRVAADSGSLRRVARGRASLPSPALVVTRPAARRRRRRSSSRSSGDVEPALAALELVPIHYESPNSTTHAAAADQLDVARETIASLEGRARGARSSRGRDGCSPISPLSSSSSGRRDRPTRRATGKQDHARICAPSSG